MDNAKGSPAEKLKERMERLKKLHTQRNEARQHNHQGKNKLIIKSPA